MSTTVYTQPFCENLRSGEVSLEIPAWRFKEFSKIRSEHNDGRRWGQQFYDYMELDKITSPANLQWANRLYQTDGNEAREMVRARVFDNVF